MPLTTRYSFPYPSATSPADAPGQFQDLAQAVDDEVNRVDTAVRSLAARSTSSLAGLTSTSALVPGTRVTFTTNHPNAVAIITASFDLSFNNTTGAETNHLIGKLFVDNLEQTAQALVRSTPNVRVVAAQTYVVTFPGAGSHSIEQRAMTSATTGNAVANAPHTGWAAVLIDR